MGRTVVWRGVCLVLLRLDVCVALGGAHVASLSQEDLHQYLTEGQPFDHQKHAAYSGLHLYEEAVLGFPLPLRERDRVRGKAGATHLLIQTKSAVASRPVQPRA